MSLLLPSVLFIIGLLLIIKGGDWFVDAAVWFAEVSGIPKVIVGATVVSLATTLPEILVSVLAALQGKADMAIGNAIGSVTANQGLILGISLLFAPLSIRRRDYAARGLLLVLAVAALWYYADSGVLSAAGSLVLLACFLLSMADNLRIARRSMEKESRRSAPQKGALLLNLGRFLFGTAGIVYGAHLMVENGSLLALRLGIPEAVVGVTLMAVGTSLPELVTAMTALCKNQGALSVGNILGANLIDTTLILPLCALLSGSDLAFSTQALLLDLPVCLLVSSLTVFPALLQQQFSRWQGLALVGMYAGYLVVLMA